MKVDSCYCPEQALSKDSVPSSKNLSRSDCYISDLTLLYGALVKRNPNPDFLVSASDQPLDITSDPC